MIRLGLFIVIHRPRKHPRLEIRLVKYASAAWMAGRGRGAAGPPRGYDGRQSGAANRGPPIGGCQWGETDVTDDGIAARAKALLESALVWDA